MRKCAYWLNMLSHGVTILENPAVHLRSSLPSYSVYTKCALSPVSATGPFRLLFFFFFLIWYAQCSFAAINTLFQLFIAKFFCSFTDFYSQILS